jgi:hypothetical protein
VTVHGQTVPVESLMATVGEPTHSPFIQTSNMYKCSANVQVIPYRNFVSCDLRENLTSFVSNRATGTV